MSKANGWRSRDRGTGSLSQVLVTNFEKKGGTRDLILLPHFTHQEYDFGYLRRITDLCVRFQIFVSDPRFMGLGSDIRLISRIYVSEFRYLHHIPDLCVGIQIFASDPQFMRRNSDICVGSPIYASDFRFMRHVSLKNHLNQDHVYNRSSCN